MATATKELVGFSCAFSSLKVAGAGENSLRARTSASHLSWRQVPASIVRARVACEISRASTSQSAYSVRSKPSPETLSLRRGRKQRSAEMAAAGDQTSLTYKDAGVDIAAGDELVKRIAKMAPGIGGFGGLFPFGDSYLVAGTDGVGTKLKMAFAMDIHDTIGIDLVAMSVNDIVTSGATPLFFLDYFASSRLDVDKAEQVIKGIVDGCKQSNCALLGGETAEMPGFYADGEYDLSGFAVGSVKKEDLIDGSAIALGDKIIGLPSTGVHSNGFSLVRRILEKTGASLDEKLPGGDGVTLGQALLAPTAIYVEQVLALVRAGGVKGIAHITGGGMTENIPRVFPKGLAARIDTKAWERPPIFHWLQTNGNVEDAEMRKTFNMGIGMILVVSPEAATKIVVGGDLKGNAPAYLIGDVVEGSAVVFV